MYFTRSSLEGYQHVPAPTYTISQPGHVCNITCHITLTVLVLRGGETSQELATVVPGVQMRCRAIRVSSHLEGRYRLPTDLPQDLRILVKVGRGLKLPSSILMVGIAAEHIAMAAGMNLGIRD